MTTPAICRQCGGEMDEGRLEQTSFYVSDNIKRKSFWSLDPKIAVSRARACLTCGYVELYLDAAQLRNYTGGG